MAENRFDRLQLLVGATGLEKLQAASVVIFGVGGVGSYAAEALVRGGVGKLTLVDFDEVCITNLNRQIHALEDTIGFSKVEVMAERCRAINPQAGVTAVDQRLTVANSQELLTENYDYVLDCIDDISAKLQLIESCYRRELPIIASMGAANKLDPALVQVADLAKTKKCRLARIIRKELRQRGIERGIKVVFSTEQFRPLTHSEGERKPLLGSTSYLPPIFGLTMAAEVIRTLLGEND